MEIEVGKWARTVDGIIGKIEQYENGEYWIRHSDIDVWKCAGDSIVKHSKKLIDLVEVGDYVNENRVVQTYRDSKKQDELYLSVVVSSKMIKEPLEDYIEEERIKTILTHEQYEANCFKRAEVENERDKI